MRDMMSKLKLTVNETEDAALLLCRRRRSTFLGYTFGRCYSPKTGRAYVGTVPSKKRDARICRAISEETGRGQASLELQTMVGNSTG